MISNDFQLLNTLVKTIPFAQALRQNKGKIIYVDFWASWCAPCIKAMPFSNKLKDDFKEDNIVFFYLALNDKKEKWESISKKMGLDHYEHNYFITNSNTNKMIEELRIESLPRYIIYGKKNELRYQHALGPENKELKNLLISLLKND